MYSCQSAKYKKLESLASDLDLVFENAKQYNIEDSQIYKVQYLRKQCINVEKFR